METDKQVILKSLKKRFNRLQKRIREEKKRYEPFLHKSRSCRKIYGGNIYDRLNWFKDRQGELLLAIRFIEGKINEKDYIQHLAGDKLDKLFCKSF